MTSYGNICREMIYDDDFMVFVNPAPWNKVYRREIVEDLRFLPFRGFNDTMFLACCFTRINKIAFVSDVLYHYYLRGTSQIHNINIEDVNNLKKYLLEVKQFYIDSDKYNEMTYILDLMAFIHLGVSVMYRISYDKTVKTKEVVEETIKYLDQNFSTWRKSPFLKFSYCIRRGIKHIGLWGISKLYKWNLPMIYIRLYRFVVDKMKIDIKW